MSDLKVSVKQYVPDMASLLDNVNMSSAFPNLMEALDEVASLYREAWLGFASGVPIPGTPRVINSRGEYKSSIKVDLSRSDEKVVYSDSVINKYIEDGSDAYDMKPAMLKGPHAKFGKNGPYNVIAFRHGVPESNTNPMPITIFKLTQKSARRIPKSVQKSNSVEVIPSNNSYGIRSKRVSSYMPGKGNYTWKTGPFAGMQKVDTSTGKAQRSSYITFRTVSIHSDPNSWIRPPVQGVPIRQAVVDTTRELAERMIREALEQDLS